MRRSNPERERHSSERLGPIMSGGGREECRRRESRDREHMPTTIPGAVRQRRVMQAYPAYANSSVIGSGPMSIPGLSPSSRSANCTPANSGVTFTISEGPRGQLEDISRSNEGYETSERQSWRGRREIAPHTAPSSGREISDVLTRSSSGNCRTNRGVIGSGAALPSSMMQPQPQTGIGGREKVRMKRSERDERSGRRSSKDDVMRQRLLESNMVSLTMDHFVVDKPVNRRSRSNLNGNQNQKPQKVTVIEPTHKPIPAKPKIENRPQTMAGVGMRVSSREQIDVNNNNTNTTNNFPSSDSEKLPIQISPVIPETRAPMNRAYASQMIAERAAAHANALSAASTHSPSTSELKLNLTKSRLSKVRVAHPFARNIKKTPSIELNPSLDQQELAELCSKCQVFSRKLKTQTQTTKNLQRQNGCLESIITQKRNLVEQLTRQVRGLMKENFQLAKGAGLEPGQESVVPADSMSATAIKGQSKVTNSDLAASSSAPALPTRVISEEGSVGAESYSRSSPPGGNSSKTKTTAPSSNRNRSTPASRTAKKMGSGVHKNPDMMEEYDKQIEALQNSNETLQKRVEKSQFENLKTSRFLTDLLYTLNARGYESITDFEGSIVDLYRCRGDHLLDLKGRDARARTPVKRMTPQETLLKAVIGSQEKLIQNLFVQLDSRTREALLGSRLCSDIATSPNGNSSDRANRNAALEGEILALVCLIEGACQRNPEVFHILQEQALSDRESKHSSGMNANNVVIEAVLDRCQRMLCTGAPPTSPRLRSRGRETSNSPRSGTPPPYQIRNGSNRSGNNRQPQLEDQAYQMPTLSNEMNQGHTTELPLIGSNKYNQGPRPMSRSNIRTKTGSGRQRQTSPSERNSSGSGSDTSPKRRPSLPRCRFCGMKFPSHYSLAEINSHIELHNL